MICLGVGWYMLRCFLISIVICAYFFEFQVCAGCQTLFVDVGIAWMRAWNSGYNGDCAVLKEYVESSILNWIPCIVVNATIVVFTLRFNIGDSWWNRRTQEVVGFVCCPMWMYFFGHGFRECHWMRQFQRWEGMWEDTGKDKWRKIGWTDRVKRGFEGCQRWRGCDVRCRIFVRREG